MGWVGEDGSNVGFRGRWVTLSASLVTVGAQIPDVDGVPNIPDTTWGTYCPLCLIGACMSWCH